MNIKNVITYSSLRLLNNIYYQIAKIRLYKQIRVDKSKKSIYLFANPTHPNIGDMAQTICIEQWFSRLYPEYSVFKIPHRFSSEKLLKLIRNRIGIADLIFVHSGFIMNDPNRDLYFILKLIPLFHDNRIVILPQTIDLINNNLKKNIVSIFDSHPNLLLLCRDYVSKEMADKLFKRCHIKAFPDFVTSMIGVHPLVANKREGILFVLRNDAEKFYGNEQIQELKTKLCAYKVDTTDTTIKRSCFYTVRNRDSIVEKTLEKFSKYQLIITDRYHGLIFSQVVSVPVIVLASTNHKLISGIEWFPTELFKHNLFFARELDDVYRIANKILSSKEVHFNPPYFYQTFFQTQI